MKLDGLPKTTAKKKKRVGRGYGSGKGGHTVGRGAKGLKARGKVALTFAGTKMKKSFLKRLPLRRGKGKFKSLKPKPITVKVGYLNLFPKGTIVDVEALIRHKVVNEKEARKYGVKVLGDGHLQMALKVMLPCSKGAKEAIEKAGGGMVAEEKEGAANKRPSVSPKKTKTPKK